MKYFEKLKDLFKALATSKSAEKPMFEVTENQVEEYAEQLFPKADYDYLYQPLSADQEPSLFADGRLITGHKKTILKDRYFNQNLINDAYNKMDKIVAVSRFNAVILSLSMAVIMFFAVSISADKMLIESQYTNQAYVEALAYGLEADIKSKQTSSVPNFITPITAILLSLIGFFVTLKSTFEVIEKGRYIKSGLIAKFLRSRVSTLIMIVVTAIIFLLAEPIYDELVQVSFIVYLLMGFLFFGILTMLGTLNQFMHIVSLSPLLAKADIGFATTQSLVYGAINNATNHFNTPTKDEYTRFHLRGEQRLSHVFNIRKQIAKRHYVDNNSRVLIGYGTGYARKKGILSAPQKGQPIVMSGDDLSQNMLVCGGTGEQKSLSVLMPLIKQFLSIKKEDCESYRQRIFNDGDLAQKGYKYGLLALDAKSALPPSILTIVKKLGREDDVVLIGTDSINGIEPKNLNLIKGMSPLELSNTLTNLKPASGESANWQKKAGLLIGHVANIARALESVSEARIDNAEPYSLYWIYTVCINEQEQEKALSLIEKRHNSGVSKLNTIIDGRSIVASMRYLSTTWLDFAVETKASIINNVDDILGELSFNDNLNSRFGKGLEDENTVSFDDLLNHQKIFLSSLNASTHGDLAVLILKLLKTQFYTSALKRLDKIGNKKCGENPVAIVFDECQQLLNGTNDLSAISDATYYNLSRACATPSIMATQTLSSLIMAMTDNNRTAYNFLDQMRSKIILPNEDKLTCELAQSLMGKELRSKVFDKHILDTGFRQNYESIEDIESSLGVDFTSVQPINNVNLNQVANGVNYSIAQVHRVESELAVLRPYTSGPKAQNTLADSQADFAKQLSDLKKRKDDKDSEYLRMGVETEHVIDPSFVSQMGMWQAVAFIKQSGYVTKDIIRMKPIYEDKD